MRRWLIAVAFCFGGLLQAANAAGESLVVFVDRDASSLQSRFLDRQLPVLEALAADMGLPVQVVDLADQPGAPAEVKITPLLVFQSWRGRSIYQGRYATPERIENFVRTARALPQGAEPLVRERLPVLSVGRAKLAVPLKITELTGPGATQEQALPTAEDFVKAVEGFELADRVELGRADRLWYANFYPHASETGHSVTAELYSQFHCHEPVWTTLDSPANAERLSDAFALAAKSLVAELHRQLGESRLGDGFDAVAESVPVAEWEALGLGLPERPAHAEARDAAGLTLGTDWVVALEPDASPAVLFAFPAPLDAYAGEATAVSGRFKLASIDTLAGATGRIAVDPRSVTMGEDDLDAWIHEGILKVDKHAEAWFDIESIDAAPGASVGFGSPTPATLVGTFTMTGQSLPLSVPVQLEAFVGEDGRPRLAMDGAWTLPIADPFGIDGPPGDEEAASKLRFLCRIVYAPAGE